MQDSSKNHNHIAMVYFMAIAILFLMPMPIYIWRIGSPVPYVIIWVILANFDKWLDLSIIIACCVLGLLQDLATATVFGTWALVNMMTYLFALGFRNMVAIKLRPNYVSAAILIALMILAMVIVGFATNLPLDILSLVLPMAVTFIFTPYVGKYFSFGVSSDE